jgi:glycerol-3-phosphate dehydrogenase
LFLTLPEDDLAYQSKFVEACRSAGIQAEVMDPKEALRLEPSANPSIIGAVRVPDGAVDPFRLTASNILDKI